MTERFRVAVIGAGPIGIELAVALQQAGIDYVQFDAAQIGATIQWYPLEMLFHSSADRLSIAGVPLQVPDQQKPKREEYLAYLRSVVQQFGLTMNASSPRSHMATAASHSRVKAFTATGAITWTRWWSRSERCTRRGFSAFRARNCRT